MARPARSSSTETGSEPRTPEPPSQRAVLVVILCTLTLFFLIQYGTSLRASFFSDDFLLLDKVRTAPLISTFGFDRLAYHWYRPWSRELHFWVFERAFGTNPLSWHLALLGLWLAAMAAFHRLVSRLAGPGFATRAVIGCATLAAWGLPLEWASGAQELWMLLWVLLSLLAFEARRSVLAAVSFTLALLCKETAATTPAIAITLALVVNRDSPGRALVRIAPFVPITIAWLVLHPAIGGHLWLAPSLAPLPTVHTPTSMVLRRSVLALGNLDLALAPAPGFIAVLPRAAAGAILLALAAFWGGGDAKPRPRSLVTFGVAWTLIGWLPMLAPSVIWQSYYVLLGAFGAWLAVATLFHRNRLAFAGLVLVLTLLGALRVDTPADEWGNVQLQRAGRAFVGRTERALKSLHPSLPRNTRVFFAGVPERSVFVLGPGDTPALRVWYSDSTIQGSFWSQYRPRSTDEDRGPDLFFRYDPRAGWREVIEGSGEQLPSRPAPLGWIEDHERLAMLLAKADDYPAAAVEFAKLATADPSNPTYAELAATCFGASDEDSAAAMWRSRAGETASREARRSSGRPAR